MPVIEERLSRLNPAPTRNTPILIGGGGEKVTLRIVAQHARIWNCLSSPEEAARKNEVLDEWCRKVGRDRGEIERSIWMTGDEEDLIGKADRYADLGISHVILVFSGPDYDLGPL